MNAQTLADKENNGVLFATHRILDSVYTFEYKLGPHPMIEIISFGRDVELGYVHEDVATHVKLIEDEGRTVTHVVLFDYLGTGYPTHKLTGEVLTVSNPQHIFSYRDKI